MDVVLRPRSLLAFEPFQWLNYSGSRAGGDRDLGRPTLAGLVPARPLVARGARRVLRVLRALRLPAGPLLLRGAGALFSRLRRVHGARHGSPGHRPSRNARCLARRVGRLDRADGRDWPRHDAGHRQGSAAGRALRPPRAADPPDSRVLRVVLRLLGRFRRVTLAPGGSARHLLHPRRHPRDPGAGDGTRAGYAVGSRSANPTRSSVEASRRTGPTCFSSSPRACARMRSARSPRPACKGRFLDASGAGPRAPGPADVAVIGDAVVVRDGVDRAGPRRRLPDDASRRGPVGGREGGRLPDGVHRLAEPQVRGLRGFPSARGPRRAGERRGPRRRAWATPTSARRTRTRPRGCSKPARGVRHDANALPYFATLHLSNTHWPYRAAADLQLFEPHDASPLSGIVKLHNHYRNAVLFQERTVSSFLRELRELPGWDDTVVLFVSDHGEEAGASTAACTTCPRSSTNR